MLYNGIKILVNYEGLNVMEHLNFKFKKKCIYKSVLDCVKIMEGFHDRRE